MDIQLTFKNGSNSNRNVNVVIAQRNENRPAAPMVAWKVIRNCGRGCTNPFVYQILIEVGIKDSFGNFSPRLQGRPGERFKAVLQASGHTVIPDGTGAADAVEVVNGLQDRITAMAYRDDRLMSDFQVQPACMASFVFSPTLFIGVVEDVVEGRTLTRCQQDQLKTTLSLAGVRSAEIVMSGDDPFTFGLVNVILD